MSQTPYGGLGRIEFRLIEEGEFILASRQLMHQPFSRVRLESFLRQAHDLPQRTRITGCAGFFQNTLDKGPDLICRIQQP